MRKVEVVPYSMDWPILFKEEAAKIEKILGKEIADIHHIGSTSIPSIYAKPVIDIMVEVYEINKVDRYNEGMEQIGYEVKGEHGISGRRFFMKGGDERTHHIHIFEKGSPNVDRHLAFRDYMIAYPEEASAYSRLKRSLAEKHPWDMDSYINGKDDYIIETEQKALEWKKSKGIGG
ncbi:GrpB family protein [Halobacillus sp. Marseille-Q1614]|uniref:GrpB family protein n=1 Tax=Halobacillus sp. Marseille-Q1614 TaxID=2709134 RepID=UPI001570A80E|nr:GrpB family protein [Halobacillus sp. Marseille-Q1614]